MNWLMHNPIADMPGPRFLLFYAVSIGVILAYGWWRLRRLDESGSLAAPPVPPRPDPYEIAHLRAGERETARVMVLALMEQQCLETSGDGEIRQRHPRPDPKTLGDAERRLFEWFSTPRKAKDLFGSGPLGVVRSLTAGYDRQFHADQLLLSPELRSAAWKIAWAAFAAITGLGAYKLAVALAKGRHNVLFLILMGIAGAIAAFAVARPGRLTARGKAYLENLTMAFAELKQAPTTPGSGGLLLLAAGLFGVGVLAGTEYDSLRRMYARSTGGDGGASCGGGDSCGGGGDGGGDGGGSGCGGCGGGGE